MKMKILGSKWPMRPTSARIGSRQKRIEVDAGILKTDPLIKERIKIDISTNRTHPQTDPDARKMQIDPKCEPIKM